jgi:PIN domain nuclease of toxin-antitoxin system
VSAPTRVLVDTHVLLWALLDPDRLGPETRDELEHGEVFVSAASIWELSIKSAAGRIDCDPAQVADAVEAVGFKHLPITAAHAAQVARLVPIHRDPFDRMLVAQAGCDSLVLLTRDHALADYGDFVKVV